MSFGPQYRIKKRKRIDEMFKLGGFYSSGFLKFRFLKQSMGHCRLAVSVSKRVGHAPCRNRIKRLIREGLRQSDHLKKHSLDLCVFITKKPQSLPSFQEIGRGLDEFFNAIDPL